MVDRGLVAAAAGFAGATAFGAFVSVRENMPGEPLGLHLPGRVPFHLRLGLGSGLSAPWPMPVAAIVAALRSRPGQTRPGRVCAAVGAILLGGTVVEPATWGLRSRAPLVSAAVALNLISGGALMMAGRRAATTRARAALPGGIHMSRTPLAIAPPTRHSPPHGGDDDAGLGPENLSQLDGGLLNDLDRRWLPRPDPDPDPCGIKAEMGDLRGDPSNAWPSCRENVYRKSMFVGTTFPTHSLLPAVSRGRRNTSLI
jgi:hypothetical protein